MESQTDRYEHPRSTYMVAALLSAIEGWKRANQKPHLVSKCTPTASSERGLCTPPSPAASHLLRTNGVSHRLPVASPPSQALTRTRSPITRLRSSTTHTQVSSFSCTVSRRWDLLHVNDVTRPVRYEASHSSIASTALNSGRQRSLRRYQSEFASAVFHYQRTHDTPFSHDLGPRRRLSLTSHDHWTCWTGWSGDVSKWDPRIGASKERHASRGWRWPVALS
jgi:hypothetical protein